MPGHNPQATRRFRQARDLLLELHGDHEAAVARFRWPRFERFNWALDWFDEVAADNDRGAVRLIAADGTAQERSYAELSARSSQTANWLRRHGVRFGDRLLLMLDNQFPVWESILAAIKLGAVVIPTYTSVSGHDLADRLDRGGVSHVLTEDRLTGWFDEHAAGLTRLNTGHEVPGWANYADGAAEPTLFTPGRETQASDPLFIYFTSGTTSLPKMVEHTHASYPVGHLTGMYWNGLMPADVHANVSAPGWAKHAWSSFFAPLNAEATVLSVAPSPGRPAALLDALRREGATSLCAPPTAWRMLLQHGLGERPPRLRDATSVGEPLNPEVIERVRERWGLTVRDGYGQTETTAMVGVAAGSAARPGSMGRPLPGYDIRIIDPETGRPAAEGEICVSLANGPLGLMTGYLGDEVRTAAVLADGYYHTGDIAAQDERGYLTYVGRGDDLFKSFDHRVSPFELESALLRHPSVAEAAVVPVPDPVGMFVPKAFVAVARGVEPTEETARDILEAVGARLASHQMIAVLEFTDLPKTASGKIRRALLREAGQHPADAESGRLAWRSEELLGKADRSAAGL